MTAVLDKLAFMRVLSDELGAKLGTPMILALEAACIDSIDDFCFLEADDVEIMTYEQNGGECVLKTLEVRKLKNVLLWSKVEAHRETDAMDHLTKNGLHDWIKGESIPPVAPPPLVVPTTTNHSPATEFARGIKRSVTDYNKLEDDKNGFLFNDLS